MCLEEDREQGHLRSCWAGFGSSIEEKAAACGWVGVGQARSWCPNVRGRLTHTVGVKGGLVAKVGLLGGPSSVGSFHCACEAAEKENTGLQARRAAPAPVAES